MRKYVIINGVNSLTINGLAINELPPISKPPMRNLIEEIDGRDGDIVTNLGYGAYDKEMSIGLYPGYNIDEVISFFNGKGTIVFSNEEDKYYNFEILEQIDYEKLLKFKTAIVTFHCQPFKYPVVQEPIEISYKYVEGQGENITLDNTAQSPMKLGFKGQIQQDSTTGKNYLPITLLETSALNGVTVKYDSKSGYITINGTATATTNFVWDFDDVSLPATTYVQYENDFSNANVQVLYFTGNTQIGGLTFSEVNRIYDLSGSLGNKTLNRCSLYIANGTTINGKFRPMITQYSAQQDYEPYTGNAPSPSPSYPQDIHIVSGDNEIKVQNKNLFDKSTATQGKGVSTSNGSLYNDTNSFVTDYIEIKPNLDYVANKYSSSSNRIYGYCYDNNKTPLENIVTNANTNTFKVTNTNAKYIRLTGLLTDIDRYQLEKGSTATDYVEHQEYTKEINLGELEVGGIGEYEDEFFKNTTDSEYYDSTLLQDKWYLHKETGKYVITSFDSKSGTSNNYMYSTSVIDNIKKPSSGATISDIVSSHFISKAPNTIYANDTTGIGINTNGTIACSFGLASGLSTKELANEWLSNNNVVVVYPLATPEYIILNDTLQETLDSFYSMQGQTNISQENNDLPFIISAKALIENSNTATINNIGNIYSKPILDIKGNGVVDVSLNNNQIFSVNVTDEVVIDSTNLEAYNPITNQLMNRQVTGNITNLKLNPGNNTLTISGSLDSSTVTNYVRYL